MSKVPMTKQGAESLREEIAHLKGRKRREIINAIATARAHGDLSENAEYHAAKEEQSFNEGRISELEDRIARAQIIDPTTIRNETVVFSATVSLIDCDSEKTVTYQIVGEDEADLEAGKISITSPVARALIGKEAGDMAIVKAPAGEREYEIQSIRYI